MPPHSPRARLLVSALTATLGLAVSPVAAASAEDGEASDRQIAQANDLTLAETREILSDPTAEVGAGDRIYYVEPAIDGPQARLAPADRQSDRAPLSDTFSLHSKSGSDRTIYLDFDGATVSGTAWNTFGGGGVRAGFHEGWDSAGDGAAFNDAEKAAVQDIFYRVAEDFAAFDVDVTTEEPPSGAITRSGGGDQTYGTRALISDSDDAHFSICGGGCGGVAYVDVFNLTGSDHDYYQPAWVFPAGLSDDPKNIAEATSHEVGHNLGLSHDGQPGDSYYSGHGGWAPLMGVGYSKPISQWSRGEYSGATQTQDDLAIMAGSGVGERSDEAGEGVFGAAQTVPEADSYVSSSSDVDTYRLGVCSGDISVTAEPAEVSPNLDIELTLLDAAGNEVEVADPTSAQTGLDSAIGLSATIDRSVTTGVMFASVDGVGRGTVDDGYSDYGSLGAYTLDVEGCGEVSAPGAPTISSAQRSHTDPEVTLTWSAPASNGGSAITGYLVLVDGQNQTTTTADSLTATFPVSDGAHSLAIVAQNDVGYGEVAALELPAASTPATPGDLAAHRDVANSELDLTWTAPDDGGVRMSGYLVAVDDITVATPGADASGATISLDDEAHSISVVATNRLGHSQAASTQVAALGAPSTPTSIEAERSADGTEATISWTAPADSDAPPLLGYTLRIDNFAVASPGPGATSVTVPVGDNATPFTLVARNRVGESAPGQVQVGALSVPAAPSQFTAQRSNDWSQATISWTAPGDTGGAPVTGYSVLLDGEPAATPGPGATQAVIDFDDDAHTVSIAAINRIGTGVASERAVAASAVPDAPSIDTVTRDVAAGEATISWSAPEGNGGVPITGYSLTIDDGPSVPFDTNTQQTTVALDNAAHHVALVAINRIGDSEPGTRRVPGVTSPSVPTIDQIVRDVVARRLTVQFSPPADDGGAPITGYEMYLDAELVDTVGSDVRSYTFTGIDAAAATVAVKAINAVGTGPAVEDLVDAVFAPGGVVGLVGARDGDTTFARLAWAPPADLGNLPLLGYDVVLNGRSTRVSDRSPRLDVGTDAVTVVVYAVNALGRGPGNSVSIAKQPVAVSVSITKPDAPGLKKAKSGRRGGKATAKARWAAPGSNGNATIQAYKIITYRMRGKKAKKHSVTISSTRRLALNQRLPRGRYTFRIQAKNAAGWSAKTRRSNVVRSR